MQKVPNEGYEIEGLWISGIQRKITLKNLLFPFKLISSLLKANAIIKKFKPNVVVGTGGFASGPTLQMANRKGIPTLVQEQNSFPGITNKLLSKKATIICVAYDGLERFFPIEKIVKTGNPVRQDLLKIEGKKNNAQHYFKLNKNKKTLLILGGSLGAKAINKLIEKQLNWLLDIKIQVVWQTGKLYHKEYQHFDKLKGTSVVKFIDKMDLAYAAADFIISRAGAGSVSELCIVGKPVIFIPSPNVSEDHQTKNALAIVNKKGALLLREDELDQFQKQFEDLKNDEKKQRELSKNIKLLALPRATEHIANEIDKLINK